MRGKEGGRGDQASRRYGPEILMEPTAEIRGGQPWVGILPEDARRSPPNLPSRPYLAGTLSQCEAQLAQADAWPKVGDPDQTRPPSVRSKRASPQSPPARRRPANAADRAAMETAVRVVPRQRDRAAAVPTSDAAVYDISSPEPRTPSPWARNPGAQKVADFADVSMAIAAKFLAMTDGDENAAIALLLSVAETEHADREAEPWTTGGTLLPAGSIPGHFWPQTGVLCAASAANNAIAAPIGTPALDQADLDAAVAIAEEDDRGFRHRGPDGYSAQSLMIALESRGCVPRWVTLPPPGDEEERHGRPWADVLFGDGALGVVVRPRGRKHFVAIRSVECCAVDGTPAVRTVVLLDSIGTRAFALSDRVLAQSLAACAIGVRIMHSPSPRVPPPHPRVPDPRAVRRDPTPPRPRRDPWAVLRGTTPVRRGRVRRVAFVAPPSPGSAAASADRSEPHAIAIAAASSSPVTCPGVCVDGSAAGTAAIGAAQSILNAHLGPAARARLARAQDLPPSAHSEGRNSPVSEGAQSLFLSGFERVLAHDAERAPGGRAAGGSVADSEQARLVGGPCSAKSARESSAASPPADVADEPTRAIWCRAIGKPSPLAARVDSLAAGHNGLLDVVVSRDEFKTKRASTMRTVPAIWHDKLAALELELIEVALEAANGRAPAGVGQRAEAAVAFLARLMQWTPTRSMEERQEASSKFEHGKSKAPALRLRFALASQGKFGELLSNFQQFGAADPVQRTGESAARLDSCAMSNSFCSLVQAGRPGAAMGLATSRGIAADSDATATQLERLIVPIESCEAEQSAALEAIRPACADVSGGLAAFAMFLRSRSARQLLGVIARCVGAGLSGWRGESLLVLRSIPDDDDDERGAWATDMLRGFIIASSEGRLPTLALLLGGYQLTPLRKKDPAKVFLVDICSRHCARRSGRSAPASFL